MPKLLLPLVALLAVGGSAAGASVYLLTRDETVVEVLPSPVVEASPTADLTPTPALSPTRTPTATEVAGKAPDGCLSSERAYSDPDGRFAFCYPGDGELTTAHNDLDGLTAANFFYPTHINSDVRIAFGIGIWPYDPCGIDSMAVEKNIRIERIVVDGQTVDACFKDHYDHSEPAAFLFTSLVFRVETEDGRKVIAEVEYTSPDPALTGTLVKEEIANRLLDSTAVH